VTGIEDEKTYVLNCVDGNTRFIPDKDMVPLERTMSVYEPPGVSVAGPLIVAVIPCPPPTVALKNPEVAPYN
jgi:hypothetical protein